MHDPEFFARLERDIADLLHDLAPDWTEEELASVRADIGYGEWGLAIEQVAGAIVRLDKPLTADLLARIDNLASRAKLTKGEPLRALHAYARRLGIVRARPVARAG